MKKIAFFLLCSMQFGFLFSQESVLASVDSVMRYSKDFNALYTITNENPAKAKTVQKAMIYRRDSSDVYTIILQEPAQDKGKGYVKQGDKLWLFDPSSKRFTNISARDRFQGTNAKLSDFALNSLSGNYSVKEIGNAKLGSYDCTIYDLDAKSASLDISKKKLWLDSTNLPRKIENYTPSGELISTVLLPDFQKVEDKMVPKTIIIVDALRGKNIDGKFINEKTIVQVANPSFKKLSDLTFTQAFLQKEGR